MNYKLRCEEVNYVIFKAAKFLSDYCKMFNIHFVVTGVSGGLDSAVSIALAKQASEMNGELDVMGLILPCQSDPRDEQLAKLVLNKFQVSYKIVDLTDLFLHTSKTMPFESKETQKIADGNIKARLRMITSYDVARKMNGIVLSNDNLSELLMGFFTLHGDVGDVGMIQNIFKGVELYDIASALDIPVQILMSKPKDGLGISESDEDQLGASYEVVDKTMIWLIQNGFDPDKGSFFPELPLNVNEYLVKKLATRCKSSAFKRLQKIPCPSRTELGLPEIENIKL